MGDAAAEVTRTVYGMSVTGLSAVHELGSPSISVDDDLLPLRVRQSAGIPPAPHSLCGNRLVRLLPCGRHLQLERSPGAATFYGAELSHDLLAHPYLGAVAVPINRWAGREVFHAGAFVAGGKAWLLVGPRMAGKSTLVGALAAAGVPILADDLVVIDGEVAHAGPRTVDLREPIPFVAGRPGWGLSAPGGTARLGTRWRILLPAIAPRTPVGGWFFLGWGDSVELTSVPMATLLGRIAGRRCLPGRPSDPNRILSLASLPGWDLRRPRDWAELPATVELLLERATMFVPSR